MTHPQIHHLTLCLAPGCRCAVCGEPIFPEAHQTLRVMALTGGRETIAAHFAHFYAPDNQQTPEYRQSMEARELAFVQSEGHELGAVA